MFLRRAAIALPLSRRFFSTNNIHDLPTSIAELNKEMESVFGEPPPTGLGSSTDIGNSTQEPQFQSYGVANSVSKNSLSQNSHGVSRESNLEAFGLTHVGDTGEAQMVDVSPKETSKRTAIASCKVVLGKKVFDMVFANQMAKGDVLTVAKLAGITGAKQTSSLIPLCHNITLTHVGVNLSLNPDDYSVEIEGEAASTGKTGVEMEVMTAVSVAGLTVYDMCKAASKEIKMTDVQLECKTGGKSGNWSRG
uniref:cyclic pyranopterin monophosphate synthase n=1 Tax=Rhizophora mucronata TaxID=61149 RepID=A0A2P2PJT0_RHIMU